MTSFSVKTSIVVMALCAFAAFADEAQKSVAELVKESQAILKADTAKSFELRKAALDRADYSDAEAKKFFDGVKWDYTIVTRDSAVGFAACEYIASHGRAPKGTKVGAIVWMAENRLAADDLDAATNLYNRAFAMEWDKRADLDGAKLKALNNTEKKAPGFSTKLRDELLGDEATVPSVRFGLLLKLAQAAAKADNRDDLYRFAKEAQKIPGAFDKRQAYYVLANYEFEKRRWGKHEDPDQMKLYLEWMEKAYKAAVNPDDMALAPEVASQVYLLISEKIMWHQGWPDKDSKLARKYFEKAIACGAKEGTGGQHWGSYHAVSNRLVDLELKEADFATFPRDWRAIDGKFFEELDKMLSSGKTVYPEWNGVDDTAAITNALNDPEVTMVVLKKTKTPWEIECIDFPAGKKLLLKEGAVLEAKKGGVVKPRALLSLQGKGHVIMGEGKGAEIRMRKDDYFNLKDIYGKFDDNRHGIGWGKGACGDTLIRNLKIASTGGDGICVTSCTRLWIDNVELDNNSRQALTLGTQCYKCYLTNCKFNNTWAAAPMAGIDVENWTENCSIGEIYCENCEFAHNRVFGLVLATSTYTPISMIFRNCEFRDNGSYSLSLLNRPGVPTVNKEIFENCRFLQKGATKPIQYVRTLIGNITYKDCLIKRIPGGSEKTSSVITVALDPNMSDFYIGKNVFDNVRVEGYEDAELLEFVPHVSGNEYIKDGAFEGVIDFNGTKVDIAKLIREKGYDKPAPEYVPAQLDFSKLYLPPLNTAIDAYIPAPFGRNVDLLYFAKKDRKIRLGFYNRITHWTQWDKGRAISVINEKGEKTEICGMEYDNDFTSCDYVIPEDGFYRFRAPGRGFWDPQDDQIWGYSYVSGAENGFADITVNDVNCVFEVPEGVKEITLQTTGREFRLYDAKGNEMVNCGSSAGLRTWRVKVENPGIWSFYLNRGQIRFFAPLNGIFAQDAANLPRMKK